MTDPVAEYERRGNDFLRDQLAALDQPSQRKRLEQLTVLEVRCRACGDTPFRVVQTRPYWVVRTWSTDHTKTPESPRIPKLNGVREYQAFFRDNPGPRVSRRRDLGSFVPISSDRRRENTELVSVCRCRTCVVTEAWLWERIDEAVRTSARRIVTIK